MNSKLFTFHNKLGEDQCIVWNQSKLSRPVLCSCNGWSVNFDFTSLFDKSGCGLKRLYIWSMSKLSLSVTSNLLIHPSCFNKLFLLFLWTHNFNTFDKHTQMYRSRSLLNWEIQRINYIGLFTEIFSIQYKRNLFVCLFKNLKPSFVKDIEIWFEGLIFFKSLFQIIQEVRWIKELGHFFDIKSTFLPLLNKAVFNIH